MNIAPLRETYLANIPNLHTWDGGKTWNAGGFDASMLNAIIRFIGEQHSAPRIIETGAGNSSIAFMLCAPSEVISICPHNSLFQRIRDFCLTKEIPVSSWKAICDYSERALPRIAYQQETSPLYDFALIDGAHGWPGPMVDFCYINAIVREGGHIMLDDVQLHSVRELCNLLMEQPGYRRVLDLGKSWIFRKENGDQSLPEWGGQPYIVRMSK